MDNVIAARAGRMTETPHTLMDRVEQIKSKETFDKVLQAKKEVENARIIARLRKTINDKARVEKALATPVKSTDVINTKVRAQEVIEVQAMKEDKKSKAVASAIPVSTEEAKRLLMQSKNTTTRADVQKLLLDLGVNLDLRLTKTDTANLLATLLTCNAQQLEALKMNPKVPIAIKIVIKRLQEDADLGNMNALERIWDRVFGKASLTLDLPEQSTVAGIIPNTPISREAYVVIRETLLK